MNYVLGILAGVLNIYLAFTNLYALLIYWVVLAAIMIYTEINHDK